ASDFLGRAGEAYGAYGRQTSRWYEWSVRVLGARLALRRGAPEEAVHLADEILGAGAPPSDALQATLIAAEALIAADRLDEAEQRLASASDALDPKVAPAGWGEFLRLRGAFQARSGSAAGAYHDFAQSAALLETSAGDGAVVYVESPAGPGGDVRIVAAAGCDLDVARVLARSASHGNAYGRGTLVVEPLGRDPEGLRYGLVASPRPIGHPVMRRLKMIAAVARQGFALCAARERSVGPAGIGVDRSLEPLL